MGATELLARTDVAVTAGVLLAAALVALARRAGRRRELPIYALFLFLTAVAYVFWGMQRHAPPRVVGIELAGALLFSAAAALGGLKRPILLGIGWTAHAAWDLFLHPAGAPLYAPAWYPTLCVGFDLFLGGYVCGIVLGAGGGWPPAAARGGKKLGPRPLVH